MLLAKFGRTLRLMDAAGGVADEVVRRRRVRRHAGARNTRLVVHFLCDRDLEFDTSTIADSTTLLRHRVRVAAGWEMFCSTKDGIGTRGWAVQLTGRLRRPENEMF